MAVRDHLHNRSATHSSESSIFKKNKNKKLHTVLKLTLLIWKRMATENQQVKRFLFYMYFEVLTNLGHETTLLYYKKTQS